MRKAMICVCFMLALVQVWPMLFDHRGGEASATVSPKIAPPGLRPAVATQAIPAPVKIAIAADAAPKSCARHYQTVDTACAASDQACHVRAEDKWDLCEATGFWPG